MLINNKFVISNDNFLQPCYRISPFTTKDIAKNIDIASISCNNRVINHKLGIDNFTFTVSGRDALKKALGHFNLHKSDVVTILTTTGNFYISSCVTKEIEKICSWSRKIEENTRLLLVNHEFGFPYENLSGLLKHHLPIIEDCAHSFASQNEECSVGKIGDFVVYSLPKIFPVQFGGILVSNKHDYIKNTLTSNEKGYLEKITNYYIPTLDEIKHKRKENYSYMEKKIALLNAAPRFQIQSRYCPGVFMFRLDGCDLPSLKLFMQRHGVESSVFYNEAAFFVPIHQSLDNMDLDYFICLIENFLKPIGGEMS